MKLCLSCNTQYISSLPDCSACGASATLVDGFYAYAPELAHAGGGFNPIHFSNLAQLENSNFWFRCRNRLILWAIKKYSSDFFSFLEIGCGTGYVLSGVAKSFPKSLLYGSEIFTAGLNIAATRLPNVHFMQMDARQIPYINEFDIIGAFDVLEHIEEDEQVLTQIYSALKPGGLMLITVPQHPWLWSTTDELACHVRRYTALDLHKKIEVAGFKILQSTSFVTFLLPALIASRFFKKDRAKKQDASAELAIPRWLNLLFSVILTVELACIKMGLHFPIGGSRLVIAKKI